MEYCFFISNARLDYFNIEKVVESLDRPVRFVLIHSKQAANRVSENFKMHMEEVFAVDCIDFDTCKTILKSFVSAGFKISVVCTDEPLLVTCAQLRQHFDLLGAKPYQYIPFNSKISMKQIVSARGVRVPRFLNFDVKSFEKNLRECHQFMFKLFDGAYVVKPIDGGACELTAKIVNVEDLLKWVETTYDPKLSYDVEEFIEGDFYHVDSFVVNNKVQFCGVSKYLFPCLEFLLGKTLGSYVIQKDTPLYEKILIFNKKVIDALQPPDGATHLEFFVRGDELIFIEIGARPAGKAVCVSYERNHNINLYEMTLRHELNIPLNINVKDGLYWGWLSFSSFPGTVMKLNPPLLKSQIHLDWKVKIGDEIQKYPNSLSEGVSAETFIYNENYEELMEDVEILKNHKAYLCQ